MTTKIGKLKKGEKFRYYGETQLYKITQSGHGRPGVDFEKYKSQDKSTFETVHKNNEVELVL